MATEPLPNLSVVILAQNEELNLPACLASVKGWSIWVVDGGSGDRTLMIADAAGVNVISHPWSGYAAQRTWALEQLPLREWVFWLDADEWVGETLRDEIERFCANPPANVNGVWIARAFIFLGRWIRWGGMWPRWHLRLVRR